MVDRGGAALEDGGGLGRELGPFRQRWTEWLPLLEGATRTTVNRLIGEIQSLRDQITEMDRRDTAALRAARDGVAQQLAHAARAQQTIGAYSAAPRGEARFTDHQG